MAGLFDRLREPKQVTFQDSVGTAFTFDAVTNEGHVLSQELTRHPIEDGSVINDHVVRPPNKLTLSTIKSSHPMSLENVIQSVAIQGVAGAVSSNGGEVGSILGAITTAVGISMVNDYTVEGEDGQRFTPVQIAYSALEKMRDDATLLTVTTEIKTYSNMVITNVSTNRNSANRNSLFADITLEEVRIAKSSTATIEKRSITPVGNKTGGGSKKPDGSGDDVPDKEKLGDAKDTSKQGQKQAKTNSLLKQAKDALFGG